RRAVDSEEWGFQSPVVGSTRLIRSMSAWSAADDGAAHLAAAWAAGFEVSRFLRAPRQPCREARPDRRDPDARPWGLRTDPRERELPVTRALRILDRYRARPRHRGPQRS